MNIKDLLENFKANSESVSNLNAEKTKLEADFQTQAELVTSLQAENKTHLEALLTAKTDMEAKDATIKDLNKQISDFNALIAEHEGKEKSAAVEAVKIVASAGVDPVPVTKTGSEENKTSSNEDVLNEYNSITDPIARSAFFKANYEAIVSKK